MAKMFNLHTSKSNCEPNTTNQQHVNENLAVTPENIINKRNDVVEH